ncbi:hypothetical protein [Thermogutta sp.]|uniref:hypothetical protein n=1 Tax=Thermogutta sp. TaxID=1962930 RepID=UPI003C7D8DFC
MITPRNLTIGATTLVALGAAALAVAAERGLGRALVPRVINPGAATSPGVDGAVVILAWDEQHRRTAEQLGRSLAPQIEAIASGAKPMRPQAARGGRPPEEADKLQGWLSDEFRQVRQERKLRILVDWRSDSGSATQRTNVKCPICGSTDHEFCYRLLDFDKVELNEIPIDDPELSCIRLSNGTCYPLGCCSGSPGSATGGTGGRLVNPGRSVVVFILGGTPEDYQREKQVFVKMLTSAVEEALRSGSRLVIKTKSTPP